MIGLGNRKDRDQPVLLHRLVQILTAPEGMLSRGRTPHMKVCFPEDELPILCLIYHSVTIHLPGKFYRFDQKLCTHKLHYTHTQGLFWAIQHFQQIFKGAQWLSGRVLDSRQRGRGFEPHWLHCVVSLSKNINPSLVLVQPRKTHPLITERLLIGYKESNQTNKRCS